MIATPKDLTHSTMPPSTKLKDVGSIRIMGSGLASVLIVPALASIKPKANINKKAKPVPTTFFWLLLLSRI